MSGRYALYYAPERESTLDLFGRHFLGRCAETGKRYEQPNLPDAGAEGVHGLTSSPRFYGFHGTIVPPFHLKDSSTPGALLERAQAFARSQPSCDLGTLSVKELGSFIALVPSQTLPVVRLAEAGLRSFHHLREQPSLAEMERRRSRGLTVTQERLLATWGYPYVLEEFRFHLTLTDSIGDTRLRKKMVKSLHGLTAPFSRTTYAIREVCVFYQSDTASPFSLIKRIPFGNTQESVCTTAD
ncbi:DUF1045 domain-containing protein [Pseudodesulfovibrio sediminis]|uniref:Phosphonate metabolism protein n=1 Tax=Pseudodesulfovibrio sediminis TaxID=2810563 RepID=A0ABM7PA17_9BACT|nr:DUF1045 domain-containing protein [Pseudodesulfovibrio sediminis]BCS89875.1 hypothetical protein PSDVSF_31170 [Pseudodesulfovibrio sediminis]